MLGVVIHHHAGYLIMAKLYFVRHQAHGIVHEFPFTEHPSQNQVALVAKHCFGLHGFGHKKTPTEPYWTRVVEVEALGPNDMPVVKEPGPIGVDAAGEAKVAAPGPTVSGTGYVTSK
jgi:hypothetical protein